MEASSPPMPPMMPYLVLDPGVTDEQGRTVLLDSKGECHTPNIKALGSNMRFSLTWQAGWILASDPIDLRTFLSNPLTLDKIDLPHFSHHQLPRQFECGLSDKPTNDGCIVVVLHPDLDETILWYHLIGGGNEWIKYDYDVGTEQADTKGLVWEKSVMSYLAPCRGKFYSFFSHKKFAVLEFNPLPTTRVMVLDGIPRVVPPNPGGFMGYSCGFEMDGQLCRFFAYHYRRPTVEAENLPLGVHAMLIAATRFATVELAGLREHIGIPSVLVSHAFSARPYFRQSARGRVVRDSWAPLPFTSSSIIHLGRSPKCFPHHHWSCGVKIQSSAFFPT